MAVVTTPEVKAHLNIGASVTTYDGEFEAFIARAEAAIAARCGPLEPTTVTAKVAGGGGTMLALPVTPVISLTSVTPVGGTALVVTDLYVTDAGMVSYNSGSWFGSRRYDVVYQAGRSTVPADLKLGVLEMVRHLWDTQRGGTVRPGSPMSTAMSNTIPGAAYLFPFRIEQLIEPHLQHGFL